MYTQRFADSRADSHARIERAIRVLEDHLHLTACLPQLRSGHLAHILAGEAHRSGRRFYEP